MMNQADPVCRWCDGTGQDSGRDQPLRPQETYEEYLLRKGRERGEQTFEEFCRLVSRENEKLEALLLSRPPQEELLAALQ